MESISSRREFMATSGAAAAAVWLGTDRESFRRAIEAARLSAAGSELQYEVLTAEQAEDIEAIAAQIIPTDDLPGAREARVIVYIDRSLGSHASDQKDSMLAGLAELNERVAGRGTQARRFSQLPNDTQLEVLREIDDTPFFNQIRFATIVGMFANPQWGGNYDGAGYKVLDFDPRFVWQPPFGEYDVEAHR